MHKKRSIVTNGLFIIFTLALGAIIGLPALAVADNGARNAMFPNKNMGMTIQNRPPKCARGFKAVNIQPKHKGGHNYLCVSERPVCSTGHQLGWQQFNASKNRFEYACYHPEG